MKYISTRGRAPQLGFFDVTLAGLATDGGLYVPDVLPVFSAVDMHVFGDASYLDIAARVIAPFVEGDLSADELKVILKKAYAVFETPDVAPLYKLSDNFFVQELFHGPTLAFKDVALQFLGHVFDHILSKRRQRVTIVGATSGDTGSAAIEAFRGKDNVNIFILHPHGRVSDIQRRQMTSVLDKNVFNVAVEGSFDDCQDLVKAMFNDPAFRQDMGLSAINSINWARILAQVVYYVFAAARAQKQTGRAATFCVPTGNFGNVYAGYIARKIGAPIERFVVATNSNDILHRFFETGAMTAGGVMPTISPSMDIQVSSNFERLLFDETGRNGTNIEKMMRQFREKGSFDVDASVISNMRGLFSSGRQSDAETQAVIGRVYKESNYVLDPHSAVAVGVAEQYRRQHPGGVMVSLATAHPAKFPDAVKAATGVHPSLPARLVDLPTRPERYEVMKADLAALQKHIRTSVGA